MEAVVNNLITLFFFKVNVEYYEFPPKYCFSSIPTILICCLISIQFKLLSNFDWFLWPMWDMLSGFQIFEDFSDIFLLMDFYFNSIIVREHTLCDLNQSDYILRLVLQPINIAYILRAFEKKCVFCCWGSVP